MSDIYDICIVGGGVNGCGIARDAAGRGKSVFLCEKGDLGEATSSSSTKLFHGGLRYLEHYAFRLVRESLQEREVLLKAMPHISWPMRFVLPHHKGLRPAWLLRLGLFIYDNLGGRKILPATRTLDLARDAAGAPLNNRFARGFEYSDCWVEDSRLVVLNARDAVDRGAEIAVRTACVSARVEEGTWSVTLEDGRTIRARALVNAAGPWAEEMARNRAGLNTSEHVRLVRGSHIVTRKLFDHDRAYIFQHADGRIVFAIPYETDFTLIGTTDVEHEGDPKTAECSPEEAAYLCKLVSEYFAKLVTTDDIVWTYSGVRPLFDDGSESASKATRDYVLKLDRDLGAPILNIYGGKITTYRKLSEDVLARLGEVMDMGKPWTAGVALPGGDFPVDGVQALAGQVAVTSDVDPATALRLAKAYGTDAIRMLTEADGDLGQDFGHGLYEVELRWLIAREWARTTDDVLWRRSKLGLRFAPAEVEVLADWMREAVKETAGPAAA
ncbi:MAG: glycerol-3-phosphate dehydrogenase [Pseudomonadota bacterium]